MDQTLQTGRLDRHPKRTPENNQSLRPVTTTRPVIARRRSRRSNPFLPRITRTGITFANLPIRVIRGSSHHPNLMPTGSKPCGHFAGVFADASQFRREIERIQKNFHTETVSLFLTGTQGCPMQTIPAGISLKTELRAPITAPSPIVTPGATKTSAASQA